MSKFCEKCGKEIPQNSKEGTCENCQNKKWGTLRKFGGWVLGGLSFVASIVLAVITKGKINGPKA